MNSNNKSHTGKLFRHLSWLKTFRVPPFSFSKFIHLDWLKGCLPLDIKSPITDFEKEVDINQCSPDTNFTDITQVFRLK